MYLKLLIKLTSILLVLVFGGILNIFAQESSCSAQLEVSKYNSETLITNATATAVNQETKKVYKSSLQDGMPFFEKLPEGEYRVTVSKNRYFRSADDFFLSCEEENNIWAIKLYSGTPKKIVRLYNRPKIMMRRLNVLTVKGSRDVNTFDPSKSRPRSNNEFGHEEPPPPSEDDLEEPPPPPPPVEPPPPAVPKRISGGVLNGKAISLPKPAYPAAAAAINVKGSVNVAVVISKTGKVISASAVSGHPLLRASAVAAARKAEFPPTLLSGQPVEVSGVLVYNFQ
jgi:TonB family protein